MVVARNIDYIHHDLERLRLILLLVAGRRACGRRGARGALVSRATLAPGAAADRGGRAHRARRATRASASRRAGGGELARLGGAFNTMLGALEESIETQRRFVADASHELRTPLTSMQTNIEVLKQQERLDPTAARAAVRATSSARRTRCAT